jgi:hypothetical protein
MDAAPGLSGILQFLTVLWCALFGCGGTDQASPPPGLVSAYGRTVEVHSRVLYQVSIAIISQDSTVTQKEVAEAVSQVCAVSKVNFIMIRKKKFSYGWSSAPEGIKCRVEARGSGDFKVTVRGKDGLTSINGGDLQ